jgi:hypothetical protein
MFVQLKFLEPSNSPICQVYTLEVIIQAAFFLGKNFLLKKYHFYIRFVYCVAIL